MTITAVKSKNYSYVPIFSYVYVLQLLQSSSCSEYTGNLNIYIDYFTAFGPAH